MNSPNTHAKDHRRITQPISSKCQPWNSSLTRANAEKYECPRGDLNQLNGRSTSGFRTS